MASAPGLFSTTTGTPQRRHSPSAYSRAAVSLAAPAGNGTITLTVRDGQLSVGPAAREGLVRMIESIPMIAARRVLKGIGFSLDRKRCCRKEALMIGQVLKDS